MAFLSHSVQSHVTSVRIQLLQKSGQSQLRFVMWVTSMAQKWEPRFEMAVWILVFTEEGSGDTRGELIHEHNIICSVHTFSGVTFHYMKVQKHTTH